MNAFRHVYAKVNSPAYVKMLYLVLVAYIISLMQVNLTGGGEQFLLAQAQNGSTQIMWVTAVMLLHFVFQFSLSLPDCRAAVSFRRWLREGCWGRLSVW